MTPVRCPYDPQGGGGVGDPDANLEAPGGGHRRGSKEHPTRLETPMGSADFRGSCLHSRFVTIKNKRVGGDHFH